MKQSLVIAFVAALGVLTGCQNTPSEGIARGEVLFRNNCTPCHGADGNGRPDIEAPGIAGLPQWYVKAQLDKYRSGARGAHPDDIQGLRMRPMSRTLVDDVDVDGVAAYVASMKPDAQVATLTTGDAAAGKNAYNTCVACHGPDGAGNEALGAPPLTNADDWYMLTQLKKFKSGVRGANPKDTSGATMRPMAMTLADEQAMIDVIAHIQTLGN